MSNVKSEIFRRTCKKYAFDLVIRKDFLDRIQEIVFVYERLLNLTTLKLETFFHQKTP